MADRPEDLRAGGRSASGPARPFQALRLAVVGIAHAAGTLTSGWRESLDAPAAHSRGEWPFRGPADGPHNGFTVSRRWKGSTMKRLAYAMTGLLLIVSAVAFAGRAATADADGGAGSAYGFERFLRRYEAANTAFVNGDPTRWLSITAEKDPVSILGGFGGLGEAGTGPVHQRYLLAATAFRPSGAIVDFEYLVKDVRGQLAYTVAIERSRVLYTGQAERRPQILRVTMMFRFDRGAWKIIHRHADTMIELQLPKADIAPHRS
jgi:hypothetical protein